MLNFESHMGVPCKKNKDDGDSLLWAGLMHFSYEDKNSRFLPGILKSQDETTGAFYRAPSRVPDRNSPPNSTKNSFSRDMSVGLLAAVATEVNEKEKKITRAAQKWMNFVAKNKGLTCNDAEDTRGKTTPSVYWIASYVGLKVPLIYRLTRFLLPIYLNLVSISAPKGYPCHLIAVMCMIFQRVVGHSALIQGAINNLHHRETSNLFFEFLSGKDISKKLLLLEKEVIKNNQGKMSQWTWERSDSEMAYLDSMGWDFIFLKTLNEKRILNKLVG